jgi:hypothetical protein
MKKKDQILLENAYETITGTGQQDVEAIVARLEPGKIYKYSTSPDSDYNNYKIVQGYGKTLGLQRLYGQGYTVLVDNDGTVRTSLKTVGALVPSEMPPEEFEQKHNKHWSSAAKEMDSYKYFD